jgi:hypothetical protein
MTARTEVARPAESQLSHEALGFLRVVLTAELAAQITQAQEHHSTVEQLSGHPDDYSHPFEAGGHSPGTALCHLRRPLGLAVACLAASQTLPGASCGQQPSGISSHTASFRGLGRVLCKTSPDLVPTGCES